MDRLRDTYRVRDKLVKVLTAARNNGAIKCVLPYTRMSSVYTKFEVLKGVDRSEVKVD